jgi:YHS domain-containing protein
MKFKKYILAVVMIAVGTIACAQAGLRKSTYNLGSNSLAISGYDPVTYFATGGPVKGNKETALVQDGVTYYFSSDDNRKTFAANPAKYEPQYGGWCAYAMGYDGSKVEVDPKTFKILDGKLYLFYNKRLTNTLKSWNKTESKLKPDADINWNKIFK